MKKEGKIIMGKGNGVTNETIVYDEENDKSQGKKVYASIELRC